MHTRRKKDKDPTYSRKRNAQTRANAAYNGIFGMDSDPDAAFSFMIEDTGLSADEKDRIETELALELHNNKKNIRPIKTVKFDKNGSPIKITTPKRGTIQRRVSKQGRLSIFSNHTKMIPTYKFKLNMEKPILSENDKKELTKFVGYIGDEKYVEEVVTKSSLKSTRTTTKDEPSRNQNKLMGGSADQYTNLVTLFNDTHKRNWGHLVAYGIAGIKTQTSDNIAVLTEQANSEHQVIEAAMKMVASKVKGGVKLTVRCGVIPDTHIATMIEYHFSKDEILAAFGVNPQTPNKPHSAYRNIVNAYVRSLFGIAPTPSAIDDEKLKEFTAYKPTLFFTRNIPADGQPYTFTFDPESNEDEVLSVTIDLRNANMPAFSELLIKESGSGEVEVHLSDMPQDKENIDPVFTSSNSSQPSQKLLEEKTPVLLTPTFTK